LIWQLGITIKQNDKRGVMTQRPNDDVALEIGHLFLEVIALRRQCELLVDALKAETEKTGETTPDAQAGSPSKMKGS